MNERASFTRQEFQYLWYLDLLRHHRQNHPGHVPGRGNQEEPQQMTTIRDPGLVHAQCWHKDKSLTQRGDDSTEAKLASLMEAFHRLVVGSPFVSRLNLIKSYALVGREELEPSSDDGGKSLSVKSVNRLSDKSLSRPLEVTNSLKGRIWNVFPTASTKLTNKTHITISV